MIQKITVLLIGLLLLCLAGAGAWVGGVRFHPEPLISKFQKKQPAKIYQFDLTSEQRLFGTLEKEDTQGVEVGIGGGIVTLSRNEIRNQTLLEGEALQALQTEILEVPRNESFFTYDEKDNFFLKWFCSQKTCSKTSKGENSVKKSGTKKSSASRYAGYMNTAQKNIGKANSRYGA